MSRSKMTNGAVERFRCREGKDRDVLWDGEVKGFGMRLSAASGTRTYVLQYRVKGTRKERLFTIGRHNDPYRVDQARAKAIKIKGDLLVGIDPVEEDAGRKDEQARQAALNEARAVTLRQVMEHYLIHRRTKHGPLRDRTKQDIRGHCEGHLSQWLDLPMATSVTRGACLESFTAMSEAAPTQANQCMRYLRALCNHARDMFATEDGEYQIFAVNPVTQMLKLRKLNPEKARKGRIPKDRIGHAWLFLRTESAEARRDTERTAADWLCSVLLTGARKMESGSLKRTDVDLVERTFRLRESVVKNHNELTLPLSSVLHEILSKRMESQDDSFAARRRRRSRSSEYVFPSFGKKSPYITDARAMMKRLSQVAGRHVTVQDLRRTAEDIAKYCKVDPDERRQLLNHLASDVHGTHYSNNPDPKVLAPAVEAMAQWVLEQAAIAGGANVIRLPVKAA